jgi:hypothetical protein
MEWGDRLVGFLEQAFQIEHLSSPQGKSYGAGRPITALELIQSSILGEDIEYYADILVDEWAAQHIIDQELGLETLLEFDMGGASETPGLVQFVLLESDFGRSFLGRKTEGQSLEFLVAVDLTARATLISGSLLALLAADAAFGPSMHEVRLPVGITNHRPDIVAASVLQRGFGLMLDQVEARGSSAWEAIGDRQGLSSQISRDSVIESYFQSVYTESESW